MKIKNRHLKAETISKQTIVAKLFFTCKNLYFEKDEIKAGCPKLEHTPLTSPGFVYDEQEMMFSTSPTIPRVYVGIPQ